MMRKTKEGGGNPQLRNHQEVNWGQAQHCPRLRKAERENYKGLRREMRSDNGKEGKTS